jgi:hypothetical protein
MLRHDERDASCPNQMKQIDKESAAGLNPRALKLASAQYPLFSVDYMRRVVGRPTPASG